MRFDIPEKEQLFDQLLEAVDEYDEEDTWKKLWYEAWDELFSTMSDQHVEIVIPGVNKLAEDLKVPQKGIYDNLTNIAVQLVWFHCFNKLNNREWGHPLALPPIVAQVYLDDPDSFDSSECDKCGYRFPGSHFKTCPLCG